uniref:DUF4537 domain-containing protein n=1 Tax=Podarcis muralis TaxID=64176 RepID=A0A670I6D2_PODMU
QLEDRKLPYTRLDYCSFSPILFTLVFHFNFPSCFWHQGEKRTFLVQFAKSFGLSEDTTCVQETASSDMFECVNGMRHSILPGDKVLAPWEPQQKRYGPGTTIQGMETRDPLRGKEDEEIIVSFWNGKKAQVPLGVALWISPVQWERIVEMIRMPLTSRKASEGQLQRPGHYSGSRRAITGCMHGCAVGGLCRLQRPCCSFISPCSRCFQHTCSFLGHPQYASCCCPKYSGCWWPPSLTEPSQRNVEEEFSSKPLLAVEGPPKEEPATVVSSSSSSSCSSSSRRGTETGLTKTTMVDHAVNTDSSLFEKPKLQEIRRPCWKYWKRSHPSSLSSKATYCEGSLGSQRHQTILRRRARNTVKNKRKKPPSTESICLFLVLLFLWVHKNILRDLG